MNMKFSFLLHLKALLLLVFFFSCNNEEAKPPGSDIASTPEELSVKMEDMPERPELDYASRHEGRIDDSVVLRQPELLRAVYEGSMDMLASGVARKMLPGKRFAGGIYS